MGKFDHMFGNSASAQGEQNVQQRFDELKLKYQSVLNAMEQEQVQLQNLHVEDNKLFIKGTVSSYDAKEKIWNQLNLRQGCETGRELSEKQAGSPAVLTALTKVWFYNIPTNLLVN